MPNGRFPCQKDPDGPGHGYHRNNRHPFRIACGKKGCRHKLNGVKMLRWLTELVSAEVLELSNLGIEQGAIGGDEGLEDEDRTGPGVVGVNLCDSRGQRFDPGLGGQTADRFCIGNVLET
ncbi:hypothetical protein I204_08563 [Kwoniella mangroviensis CBS 8886]|nr:hypothetical protein I204_08563 [Kwoniella mangroviensis CBS 8886]